MDVLVKAEREMANGNFWRAKEILQGAVAHPGYKAEVYEKLGVVLLEMRDLAEAGKYLFLSGARKPEYDEAIDIFLRKHSKKSHILLGQFPRSARLRSLSDYPPNVAEKLRELGLPEKLRDENGHPLPLVEAKSRRDLIACFSLIAITAALLILGVVKLFEIIF